MLHKSCFKVVTSKLVFQFQQFIFKTFKTTLTSRQRNMFIIDKICRVWQWKCFSFQICTVWFFLFEFCAHVVIFFRKNDSAAWLIIQLPWLMLYINTRIFSLPISLIIAKCIPWFLDTRYIYDVQFEKASRSLRDKEILNTLLSHKKAMSLLPCHWWTP